MIRLTADFTDVVLRTVRVADAAFILSLRNNPELSQHLSRSSAQLQDQEEWLTRYQEREKAGREYYFIIEHDGESVGTVRMYDFRENSFCWGSWIIQRGHSPKVAIASAIMVYDYGFGPLGFANCHFDVRKKNRSVLRFHQSMGAVIVGSTELDELLELKGTDYPEARERLLAKLGRIP